MIRGALLSCNILLVFLMVGGQLPVNAQQEFSDCLGQVEFIAVTEQVTFNAARVHCTTSFGATLARISNDEEDAFVRNLLNNIPGVDEQFDFWIGLEDVNDQGGNDPSRFTFVDLSTDGLDFFKTRSESPWKDDQPNDSGNQNCVAYVTHSHFTNKLFVLDLFVQIMVGPIKNVTRKKVFFVEGSVNFYQPSHQQRYQQVHPHRFLPLVRILKTTTN